MIPAYVKTHAYYLILIALGIVGFRSFLAEHDARLLVTQQLKISEEKLSGMAAQMNAVNAARDQQKQAVTQAVAAIKTTPQAIAAIPQFTNAPLNAKISPGDPSQISVAALPLIDLLGKCKTDEIELMACTENSKTKDAIIAEKDKDISALKKPQNFWKRTLSTLKAVGIGIGIGAALSAHGL